jgi:hypothetical protein
MTPARQAPPRHELPDIDAAALEAARAGDEMVRAARDAGNDRWRRYLEPIPGRLRDDALPDLRAAARLARAAYGPKDSVRDALPADATEPFLDRIDRLLKALARYDAQR